VVCTFVIHVPVYHHLVSACGDVVLVAEWCRLALAFMFARVIMYHQSWLSVVNRERDRSRGECAMCMSNLSSMSNLWRCVHVHTF